jgi:acetyl esterase/lipase
VPRGHWITLIAALWAAPVSAQSPPRPPAGDPAARRIVYAVAGMDRVRVQRLTYRTTGNVALPMHVYAPPGLARGERRPGVILIHGGPIPPEVSPPDWGVYRSYGELLGASGLTAVTFKHRLHDLQAFPTATEDLRALLRHVRANAESLQIDPERIALWAFSGGGPLLSVAFEPPALGIRCVASYYAILDLRPGPEAPPILPLAVAEAHSPVHLLAQGSGPFPATLIARAARDQPVINASVDAFSKAALAKDIDLELLTLPRGGHGFDAEDEGRSREVIRRTVDFFKAHLEKR